MTFLKNFYHINQWTASPSLPCGKHLNSSHMLLSQHLPDKWRRNFMTPLSFKWEQHKKQALGWKRVNRTWEMLYKIHIVQWIHIQDIERIVKLTIQIINQPITNFLCLSATIYLWWSVDKLGELFFLCNMCLILELRWSGWQPVPLSNEISHCPKSCRNKNQHSEVFIQWMACWNW